MSTLRELKGRIGSVASTEKITGAMKMISSAKMHKAEQALSRIVPFRNQLRTIMGNLVSTDAEYTSELTEVRDLKTVAVVILGSDDGLCGAYNINLFKGLLSHINELRKKHAGVKVVVYPVGKKMVKAVSKLKADGVDYKALPGVSSKSGIDEVRAMTAELRDAFLRKEFDAVDVVAMKFISSGRQRINVQRLLPVSADAFDAAEKGNRPYIFEPDANKIYNTILPLYIISVMQEVFGQNAASEQAARVMAMQSANDNAIKLLDSLELEYNKLRQQSITTELLDILGGQVDK
ncbi:MAG TPA: ATP synthase F1 subunit gamma [Candidatus Limisoma gallistercoris]|nr:ATP synthase F1 subunit gamma [Candidatus Limisoma gallistercoris]